MTTLAILSGQRAAVAVDLRHYPAPKSPTTPSQGDYKVEGRSDVLARPILDSNGHVLVTEPTLAVVQDTDGKWYLLKDPAAPERDIRLREFTAWEQGAKRNGTIPASPASGAARATVADADDSVLSGTVSYTGGAWGIGEPITQHSAPCAGTTTTHSGGDPGQLKIGLDLGHNCEEAPRAFAFLMQLAENAAHMLNSGSSLADVQAYVNRSEKAFMASISPRTASGSANRSGSPVGGGAGAVTNAADTVTQTYGSGGPPVPLNPVASGQASRTTLKPGGRLHTLK